MTGVTPTALERRRILAVDDDADYLDSLAEVLRRDGYDVVLARSGEDAIQLLAEQGVDCILLDLTMPGLGGHETCRQIKDSPAVRDTPLIVLTARSDRDAMLESLGAGADDYIAKSGDLEVLKARVRAQIRRKHFEEENRRIREELLHREIEATETRAARELAETRAALVEELENKNRELEAFSYSVSHDLMAPLRAIDGFSAALLEDAGDQLDERSREHLARVRAATKRMGELIADLLELSSVGRVDLRRTTVDLSRLAEVVVATLRRSDAAREVEIVIEPGLCVDGDSRLLQVVLENALGNAWKFTARAETPRIELASTMQDGVRVFQVRDNGAGFDMNFVKRLFTPFQRLHAASDYAGTGIGLATIRRIVERHGGRVWAEGRVGQGATLSFTIPSKRVP
ncbi:MAG TPA: response regulator [Labilithrix sp.]|nr:response regulator [Labilithrix sp.]